MLENILSFEHQREFNRIIEGIPEEVMEVYRELNRKLRRVP